MLGPLGNRLDEVKAAVDEYQRAGYQLGVTVQFVLLCPALLRHNQPEAALEVIDQGLSIVDHNSERFFEAELYRLKASALLMRGASDSDADFVWDRLCEQHAANRRDRLSFARQPTWPDSGRIKASAPKRSISLLPRMAALRRALTRRISRTRILCSPSFEVD